MNFVMKFLAPILLFTTLWSLPTHSASFDCSKATTETELAICNDDELSALDDNLNFIYNALLEISDEKESLVIAQRDWLKSRDNLNSNFADLFAAISKRTEVLYDDYNFKTCIYKFKTAKCYKVFSKIATAPIQVNLLRIGDGLAIELEAEGIKYEGSYSEKSLDFIYNWNKDKIVFLIWSPDIGTYVLNPRTRETTKIFGMTSYERGRPEIEMPHSITFAHRNYCDRWATDSRGSTSDFCKSSALSLWKLELERKLKKVEGKDDLQKSLFHALSAIPNYWGQLEIIKDFTNYLPDN